MADSKAGLTFTPAGAYSAAKKGNGVDSVKAITGATGISGYEAAGCSFFGWIYPTSATARVLTALSINASGGEIIPFDYVSGGIGANYRNSAGFAPGIPRIPAALNTWHFAVVSWIPGPGATGTVSFSLNNGTPLTAVKNKGTEVANQYFQLGSNYSGTVSGAVIDELGFTLGALTADEISYLYNGGAGRAYSEL